MRKRMACILICIMMGLTLFSVHRTVEAKTIKNIRIGDYIQFGRYYDQPILWRYVADDENGKLILSDKVICKKAYDNIGKVASGSHAKRLGYPGKFMQNSNYWGDSNIRLWLNSKAPAGEVDWLCGNPPYYYADEKGFLADGNFTAAERTLIKKVKQKTLLDITDLLCAEGGAFEAWGHTFEGFEDFIVNHYDDICYEYIEDMMFLPDFKQIHSMLQNSDILGDKYLIAGITPQAKENDYELKEAREEANKGEFFQKRYDELLSESFSETTSSYYLRTPYGYNDEPLCGTSVFYISSETDELSEAMLSEEIGYSTLGIRPAFYLNERNARITSGKGTEDNPYLLTSRLKNDATYNNDFDIRSPYQKTSDIAIVCNGTKLELTHSPFYQDRIMWVPMRAVLEAMGAEINWFGGTEVIVVSSDASTCIMQLRNDTVIKNGKEFTAEHSPILLNDTGYMPLNLVAACLDAKVEWVYADREIVITK